MCFFLVREPIDENCDSSRLLMISTYIYSIYMIVNLSWKSTTHTSSMFTLLQQSWKMIHFCTVLETVVLKGPIEP